MKTSFEVGLLRGVGCCWGLILLTISIAADATWKQRYESPPDVVLPTGTDAMGRVRPVKTIGLDGLQGGLFTHSQDRFLMFGRSRVVLLDFANDLPLMDYTLAGGEITTVAVSLRDDAVLVGDDSGTFRMWFSSTGYPFLEHRGHEAPITASVFSPDGHSFATASDDGQFHVWSLQAGPEPILSGQMEARIKTLSYSSTGDLLLVGGQSFLVRVIDVATGNVRQELSEEASFLLTADISVDESEIYTAHRRNPTHRVWDLETGQLKRERATNQSSRDAFIVSSLEQTATVEGSGLISTYSLVDGKRLRQHLYGSTTAVSLSDSGEFLFRYANLGLNNTRGSTFGEIYQRESDDRITIFPNHAGGVLSLAVSPDSRLIAASGNGLLRATRVVDRETGQIRQTIPAVFTDLEFSENGSSIYSAAGGFFSYSALSGGTTFHGHGIAGISMKDHLLLLRERNQGDAIVIDAATEQVVAELAGSGGIENGSFRFSSDQALVGMLSQRLIRIWETATGELQREIRLDLPFHSIQFTPDNERLISVHRDEGIAIWDVKGRFEPLWAAGFPSELIATDIAPSGDHMALGLFDGTILQMDLETGSIRSDLVGHSSMVTALAFSPDGEWLVSGDTDGLVKVWPVDFDGVEPIRITRRVGDSLRVATPLNAALGMSIVWLKDGEVVSAPESVLPEQLHIETLKSDHAGMYLGRIRTPSGRLVETVSLALTVLQPVETSLTYEQWTLQFPWGTLSHDPVADADHDSLNNLGEYLLGLNPLEPNAATSPLQIHHSVGGSLVLELFVAPHARETEVHLEATEDLGDWAPLEQPFTRISRPDGSEIREVHLSRAQNTRFYRLALGQP